MTNVLRMKTVWLETDERGEIVWNPGFLDFARYWGFTPRLCRPYRAQTKGKVESGVKYIRRNFLCRLQGREPCGLSDLGSRYSVPWEYAGRSGWVRERGNEVEVHYGRDRIAAHGQARHKHLVVTQPEHHRGIPLGARQEHKILVHIQDTAPVVEIRPLAAYESAAMGGGR